MFPLFIKTAWRRARNKFFFSFVNVAGLAVAMAACWLIGLFVRQELKYDDYLPEAGRICQVALDLKFGEEEGITSNTPPPVSAALTDNFNEIEAGTRVFDPGDVVVQRKEADKTPLLFNESSLLAVDSNFVEMFGFPLLEGDGAACLDRPDAVVLTEKTAHKYFGAEPALHKTLQVGEGYCTVTAVLKDLPAQSSLQFDMLRPMEAFKVVKRFDWSWVWLQVDTWVRLREQPDAASLTSLESRFPAMVDRLAAPAFDRIGQNYADFLKNGGRWKIRLRPLSDVHLYSAGLDTRLQTLGDIGQVRMFGMVGLFILLLACINFMNLSTARSMQRAREVGVRKALGSRRGALAGQFLLESLLYSVAATGIAALLAFTALPFFNRLTGLDLPFRDMLSGNMAWLVAGLPLLAGLLGGLYPAVYLSGFQTSSIFKGVAPGGKNGQRRLRSGLVVFQFTVSTVLIICTVIVFRQLEYTRSKPLGFNKENVLVIENARRLGKAESSLETFRQDLLKLPEVSGATRSTALPALGNFGDFYVPEQGGQSRPVVKDLSLSSFIADYDFVPVMGIRLAEGRNFSADFPSDSMGVILNEAAVKAIGWEEPLGKWMRYPGGGNTRFQVIGVIKDFHLASLHVPITPFALFHESSHTYDVKDAYFAVQLKPGTEKKAIAKMETLWKSAAPEAPFAYAFLDADFARLYHTEEKTGAVLGIFTVLGMLIACLGLFALAAYTAEQRTKEIGIRKVLGATVGSVAGLLTKDFLALVMLAIVLATPVAWYFMYKWLAGFAYAVDLQWWVFALAGAAAVTVAFLTVGFQSVKAALTDPVRALRNE